MKYAVIAGAREAGVATASLLVAKQLGSNALSFNGLVHKEFTHSDVGASIKPEFVLVDFASHAPQLLKNAFDWCEANRAVLVCIDDDMQALHSAGLDASNLGMTIMIVGLRDTDDGYLFQCKGVVDQPVRDLSAQDIAMTISMFRTSTMAAEPSDQSPSARAGLSSGKSQQRSDSPRGKAGQRGIYAVITPASDVMGFLVLLAWMLATESSLDGLLVAGMCMLGILRALKSRLFWVSPAKKEPSPFNPTLQVGLGMCSGAIAAYFATLVTSALMHP